MAFTAIPPWGIPSGPFPGRLTPISIRDGGTSPAGTASFNLTGFVLGRAASGEAPLGNVPVRLWAQGNGPFNAPLVDETTTASNGSYGFPSVPAGNYWVAAVPANGFGGEGLPVSDSTNGVTLHLNVTVFPQVPYDNRTFVLPHWDNWSQYDGGYPDQAMKPVLSWTQDGAFYVNASSLLVFYSFANGTAYPIAPWLHLYENIMDYGGFDNELFTTQDGSYLYEFGCLTSCGSSSPITFYAVNVTTGAHVEYNFSGATDANLVTNGQIDMIGQDGSHFIATLIESDGTVLGYNLLNRTQWTLGHLSFFEANNIYWEAYLNAYVNVQAEGSSADGIVEYQLQGPAPGTRLVPVYTGTYGSGYVSNGVDGTLLNVTSHTLVVAEASNNPNIAAILWEEFGYNASTGILTGMIASNDNPSGTVSGSNYDINGAPCGCASEVERPTIVSNGPGFNVAWNPTFNNSSWIANPGGQGWIDTNVTPINPVSAQHFDAFSTRSAPGFFRNTSYLLSNMNAFCAGNSGNGTRCNIDGDYGSPVGTVWYLWRTGAPEFPFPATSALAQVGAPGAPLLRSVTHQATNVTVAWMSPSSGAQPIVNWTLFWGLLNGSWTHARALFGSNRTTTVTDLLPQTTYFFALEAWNLHWHGPLAYFQETTGAAAGTYNVTLSETGLPPGTPWTATLGGSSNSSSTPEIGFAVPNGTYPFQVDSPVPGPWGTRYIAIPSSGNVTVAGGPRTVNISFALQYHLGTSVFPSGAGNVAPAPGWYAAGARVNLTAWGARGSAFSFWSGTGTGNYSGPDDPAFVTMEAPVNESAYFTPETNYPLSFVWTNPSPGITWSVDVGGISISSTASTITFNETNGTYPYRIETPISGGTGVQYVVTSSASGNITVGTKPVTEPVTYGTQYYLTMGASPSGSATLSPANGWENSGASVSISATPKSGYTFRSWSGEGSGNYTGGANPASVTMNGPVSEVANLVFTGTSAVSFLESGLPSGTNWSVTMNGVTRSSTGANITFNVSAGNYTYLVQGPLAGSWGTRYVPNPSAGTLQANAPTISVPVTYATQYEVTTFASPSGGGSVSPAGSNWITAGSSVKVMALAASGYVLSGWSCTPSTQCPSSPVDPFTFTVNGVTNITADFTAVPTDPVTFLESGLPGGTSWSVTLNGATHSSTGANITFNVTAGDYSYLIASPIPGTTGVRYVSSVAPGTLAVSSPVVTKDSFVTQYLVTGTASPTGDGSMSPLGSNWFDQGAFVTLLAAPAAGYQFQGWMGNGAGSYSGPGASVPLTISGPIGEEALFAPLPATYTVNITLQPAGCGWVQIEGNSYGNGSQVSLGAGNYSVGIEACPGYALSLPGTRGTGGVSLATGLNSSGRNGTSFSMVVTGDGGLEVTFVPVTTTSWISGSVDPVGAKVTVDNRTVNVTAQGTFNVSVAPGTHQVTVSATGYAPQTFRVSVTAGEGAHMTFTLTPNPTTPPTPGPAGIPWDLAGGLMLVLLVVGVLLGFVIGRRRSRTPPPTGQGTSAPPKL